jgi:hypothetical protein
MLNYRTTNEIQKRIPVFDEPEAKVLNLCKTVNCIAVYGITMSKAGTLPRQKPYNMSDKKGNTHFSTEKKVDINLPQDILHNSSIVTYANVAISQNLFNGYGNIDRLLKEKTKHWGN